MGRNVSLDWDIFEPYLQKVRSLTDASGSCEGTHATR